MVSLYLSNKILSEIVKCSIIINKSDENIVTKDISIFQSYANGMSGSNDEARSYGRSYGNKLILYY